MKRQNGCTSRTVHPVLAMAAIMFMISIPSGAMPDQDALETLKAKVPTASITIYPVLTSAGPKVELAELLGLFMEKLGMENIQTTDTAFTEIPGKDFAETAAAFGRFVAEKSPSTDYALYACYDGPDAVGYKVGLTIVDGNGEVALAMTIAADDPDLKDLTRPNPMAYTAIVSYRLKKELKINPRPGWNPNEGNMHQLWTRKSGMPGQEEMKAIKERLADFRKQAGASSLAVYPSLVYRSTADGIEKSSPAGSAEDIIADIDRSIIGSMTAETEAPIFDIQLQSNELRSLWEFARAFRDYIRANPPEADYALRAHYLIGPSGAGGVHTVMCDKKGNWVIVELQNDHHADFKAIRPGNVEDCGKLVARRFSGYLSSKGVFATLMQLLTSGK
jgi:hypothetical protein